MIPNLTAMGGKLYFVAPSFGNGYELWVYDPSKDVNSGENPRMVDDIWPGMIRTVKIAVIPIV